MATHSNVLVWEIPWTEEPGQLQSTESKRVGHDLVIKEQQNIYIKMHIGKNVEELTHGLYLRDEVIDLFYFLLLFYIPDLYNRSILLYLNQKIPDTPS